MPTPDLTPAEEAAVRARLAEARHTGPLPEPVAARLDAVLADLTADLAPERRPQDAPAMAPVVPLSAPPARRRRALATGLVAAAAVVVLGVGLPQVLDAGGSGGDRSASTADSGSAVEAGPGGGAGSDSSGSAAQSAPSPLSESAGTPDGKRTGSGFAAPVVLRSGQPLRPAVRPLARLGVTGAYDADPGCVLDVGAGDRVDATWDGLPAVVVLHPAEAGRRLVEVYVCGSGEVVGSTSLRAR